MKTVAFHVPLVGMFPVGVIVVSSCKSVNSYNWKHFLTAPVRIEIPPRHDQVVANLHPDVWINMTK